MQGHTAFITYRVQWSYGYGWDIEADHFDVPAFRKISCCYLLKPLLLPFLYVVGAEHRVCDSVSPHEPASSDATDGCYLLRNHWFFSIIILLLVTRSHTKTRHRVTLNGTAHWAMCISVWDGNPFSASWSYAPKGPGLNWCLAASGNPPPSWLKCCRIGLTFMLLRFDSPPVPASRTATRRDLNWFWQLIPVVSVSSKCSVVIHPVRNHHFHHHLFFAQNCKTRNTTEDKDGLKPYTTTDMRKKPFGIPPMELKRDIPYLLGA